MVESSCKVTEECAGLVAALHKRLREPALKEVMLAWAAWQAKRQMGVALELEDMAQVFRAEDFDDVDACYAARLGAWREEDREEGRAQGRTEGREQGLAEGQRALSCRQAELKFGEESAARLAERLENVTDREAFDAILTAIVGTDTPSWRLALAIATATSRRENGTSAPGGG